jgi:hypothetical protein
VTEGAGLDRLAAAYLGERDGIELIVSSGAPEPTAPERGASFVPLSCHFGRL